MKVWGEAGKLRGKLPFLVMTKISVMPSTPLSAPPPPPQTLSKRTSELESLRSEWSARTSSLSSEHSVSLAAEREKALQTQTEMAGKFAREKREMEETHAARVSLSAPLHCARLIVISFPAEGLGRACG